MPATKKQDTTTGVIPAQGCIVLNNPIDIAGVKTKEFDYDMNKMNKRFYMEAVALASREVATMMNGPTMSLSEFDPNAHLYIGWATVVANDPLNVTFSALDRVSGYDLQKIVRVGRAFVLGSAATAENS